MLLGAVALLAHGLLLLNDGIYWDDWLLFQQLQRHDWPAIDALVREAGVTPLNSAFLHLFAYAPGGVFSFKLAVFLLIVAGACLVYLIALEAGLGRLTAWCVAALQKVEHNSRGGPQGKPGWAGGAWGSAAPRCRPGCAESSDPRPALTC